MSVHRRNASRRYWNRILKKHGLGMNAGKCPKMNKPGRRARIITTGAYAGLK